MSQQSVTPPFFILPRELRDEVYTVLFQPGVYEFDEHDFSLDLTLGHAAQQGGDWVHLPLWLLTCKRMLDEGLAYFYEHAVCNNIRYGAEPVKSGNLLSIHRTRLFHLNVNIDTHSKMELETRVLDFMKALSAGGLPRSAPVKHVTLDLCLHSSWDERSPFCDAGQLEVDISPLEGFGRGVQKIDIMIQEPQFLELSLSHLQRVEVHYTHLQCELEKLAKRLVGGSVGSGWSVRDWLDGRRIRDKLYGDYVQSNWHLQVCSAESAAHGAIRCKGMASWNLWQGDHYTSRHESPHGEVGWLGEGGEVVVIRP